MRSSKNADDYATLTDVLIEVYHEYKKIGESFGYFCCILPTAPFVCSDDLIKSYKKILQIDVDCVLSVSRFSYPVQRALQENEDGKLEMSLPEYKNTRSQDLKPMFHDAGHTILLNQIH